MKNLLLVLALLSVFTCSFAQELTPETQITIQYADHARTLTMAELQCEMETFATSNDGYKQDNVTVIPMSGQDREYLKQQSELMETSAIDYKSGQSRSTGDRQTGMTYNEQWGIEDTFSAYVDAAAVFTGDANLRKFDAHFLTGAYIMGSQIEVIGIGCLMQSGESTPAQAETYCRVFGAEYTWSGSLEYQWSVEGEYAASTVIMIGPVPVTVKGIVGGRLGFHAYLSVVEGGIQGTFTPNIVLWGKAQASVDAVIAEVGVRGEIVFLNDSLPVTGSVRLKPNLTTLEFHIKAENYLAALSGKIEIFLKVWTPVGHEDFAFTLFEWEGITKYWIIFEEHKTIEL